MSRFWFIGLLIALLLGACSNEKERETTTNGNAEVLPEASGEPGELVVVMNKDQWNGTLGDALKDVFHGNVPGLTRDEPFFTTRVIEPFQFNRIFKLAGNLVYVTTFDGRSPADKWLQETFTEASKERIMNDPGLFMRTRDDQYASGQKVLRLFAKDEKTLISKLSENKELIRNYFNIAEKQRLAKKLRTSTASRKITERLREKFNYQVKIPAGYELAMSKDDFAWIRFLPNIGPSKNLFVYFKPYESQDEFKHDNIIKLRNEIGKSYIYGDPKNPGSFMVTEEKYVPISQRDISFENMYTVETRGAWKTNNSSVGGTFISYTFVDQPSNRLYYVEGFIIHPNEEHRELIREMESILTTFKPLPDKSQAAAF